MTSEQWVSLFFIVLPAVDLAATLIMWRWVRDAGGWGSSATFLRMGAATTTAVFLSTSIIAGLSLWGLAGVPPDREVRLALAVLAIALPSLMSVVWVFIWWRGRH